MFLFNQTLKDIENKWRGVVGYDMRYDEFEQLSRKSWEEEDDCLRIHRSKKKIREDIVSVRNPKSKYFVCTPETKGLWLT